MKLGGGNRNQTILAAVLGVCALGAVVYIGIQVEETFGSGSSTPSTSAPAEAAVPVAPQVSAAPVPTMGKAAKPMGTTSAALDPTLHMEAMLVSESVVYAGSGRNIFSPNSAPPPVMIQKPIAPARPQSTVLQVQAPPPPPPTCPPQCPPIDLKFFGTVSSNGKQKAFLLQNDNVYLAAAGDVVLRRYRVISIESRAIQMEDLQNNNRQILPLLISNQ